MTQVYYAAAVTTDIYPFKNTQQEERFSVLLQNLRCLVCQNQNLADSNAPLAEDLRQQIYEMVIKGDSDDEIIKYLLKRYGKFILFKPDLDPNTYLLWIGPFILFLMAGIAFGRFVYRRRM
ncbi:MAG: cytochrome c-type biogenesis protein CcmH [Proteobacteria bacterium]|nr:cytochrome c-type biogenesis protein CcmH [Pseudomonadota bacterium]